MANELRDTLEAEASAASLMAGDLNPQKIATAFRRSRPIDPLIGTRETDLYNRALDETVRYLTAIASKLSGYDEAFAAESLRRLSMGLEHVNEILDGIDRIKQGVDSLKPEKHYGDFEKSYRQVAKTELDYLELYGTGLSSASKRHPLHVGYISLGLQEDGQEADDAGPIPVDSVFDQMEPGRDRLFIVGEAGSGKSTIMRWAAMTAAGFTDFTYKRHAANEEELEKGVLFSKTETRKSARPKGSVAQRSVPHGRLLFTDDSSTLSVADSSVTPWRGRVPFLIRLRDCDDGRLPRIEQWAERLRRDGMLGETPQGWVESVLREGRALLLIDGVDEVAKEHRDAVQRDIAAFLKQWKGNFCVVTTRPAAVEHGWLKGLGFEEVRISPMSNADRSQFIDHWHEAVAEAALITGKTDNKSKELAAALKKKLADTPELARLATNPLLGAMICALHRDLDKVLPRRSHGVVEELVKTLLQRDELTGMGSAHLPEAYKALDEDQRKDIVQDIAVAMIQASRSSLDRTDIIPAIEQRLRHISGRDPAESGDVLLALIERSGILKIVRQTAAGPQANHPQTVEFSHNTFRDYLAARHFAQQNGDALLKLLVNLWKDGGFDPVLLFAVAVPGKQDFATRLVNRFVSKEDSNKTRSTRDKKVTAAEHARRFMAVRLRASATYLDPDLTSCVDAITKGMFPPRTMSDAEALAAMGDSAIPFLPKKPPSNARRAAATVRLLRLMGTEQASVRLQSYVEETRITVLIELAQAVNPLTLPAVQAMVSNTDEGVPKAIRSQIRDLTPLAKLATLQTLNLALTQVSDLSPIAGLKVLQGLYLSGIKLSDLSPIAGLKALQTLYLSRTRVSDLSPIAGLKALETLNLTGTQVSDLSPIAGLKALESLSLDGTPVSDLSPITGLKSLETLNLTRTQVSDLSSIAGLKALQELYLGGTEVSDLSPLAGLKALETLYLNGTQVSDLSPIAELKALQDLYINGTPVSDLSHIAGLKALQDLYLGGTQVSDLAPIAGLKALETLYLEGTQVSDLGPLMGLAKLRCLTVRGLKLSDHTSLEALKKRGCEFHEA